MKRLIVTADDVGMHRAMTDGAIEAYQRGIVTACSVVVTGSDFARAAKELGRFPELDAGVHLSLVEGVPISPAGSVASLMDGGGLRRDWRRFAAAWLQGRVRAGEVELELRAQIEKARSEGLTVRHLNGHQHLHLLPGIWSIVQNLAQEFGVGYVRVANDRGGSVSLERRLPVMLLSALGRRDRRTAQVTTNGRSIGIAEAGVLDEARLVRLFGHVDGVTELVTHPAVEEPSLSSAYDWGYQWGGELRALCSASVRRAIIREGITLVRPRDVESARPGSN